MAKQKRAKLTYKEMISYMEAMRINIVQLQGALERVNAVLTNYIDFSGHGDEYLKWLKDKQESRNDVASEKKVQEKEASEEK